MNIFILDLHPGTCAEYHSDIHLRKMILETAQLLCTAHHLKPSPCFDEYPITLYKPTHPNHPCSVWLRESMMNYVWLVSLGKALCDEYTYRFDKVHATTKLMDWLVDHAPALPLKLITPFPLVMDEHYHLVKEIVDHKYIMKDIVRSYRKYYRMTKLWFGTKGLAKWTKREPPYWAISKLEKLVAERG